jgi:galactokinase
MALDANDEKQIGRLMHDCHESLQHDFEVSCRELDLMAEAAWSAPGCVGARMTGGGFGGACVALVKENLTEQFKQSLLQCYDTNSGLKGEAMVCRAADGARILEH